MLDGVDEARDVVSISDMPSLSANLRKTLHFIADSLKSIDQSWTFTGSVGMAHQAMGVDIGDIDLQTTQAGSY